MEVFFYIFFLLFSEELKIYLLFFSICIEIFFKRVRIPRVLFIMFAIDSTGLEFYFAKIVSASHMKNSQYPYFFFFFKYSSSNGIQDRNDIENFYDRWA